MRLLTVTFFLFHAASRTTFDCIIMRCLLQYQAIIMENGSVHSFDCELRLLMGQEVEKK